MASIRIYTVTVDRKVLNGWYGDIGEAAGVHNRLASEQPAPLIETWGVDLDDAVADVNAFLEGWVPSGAAVTTRAAARGPGVADGAA